MSFTFGDFLEDAEKGYGGVEEAGREGSTRRCGAGGRRVALLVDFGAEGRRRR